MIVWICILVDKWQKKNQWDASTAAQNVQENNRALAIKVFLERPESDHFTHSKGKQSISKQKSSQLSFCH